MFPTIIIPIAIVILIKDHCICPFINGNIENRDLADHKEKIQKITKITKVTSSINSKPRFLLTRFYPLFKK